MSRFLIVFTLLSLSFSSSVQAFPDGSITQLIKMVQQLDAVLTKMDKQFRTLQRAENIANNVRNIENIRDISFDDIRNGNLSRMIRNLRNGLESLKENPFSSSISSFKDLLKILKDLKQFGLSREDKELVDEQIKIIEELERVEIVERASVENFEQSLANNSAREGTNLIANNTSTLALIAIAEHKTKVKERLQTKKADALAEEVLRKVQSGYLAPKKKK